MKRLPESAAIANAVIAVIAGARALIWRIPLPSTSRSVLAAR